MDKLKEWKKMEMKDKIKYNGFKGFQRGELAKFSSNAFSRQEENKQEKKRIKWC